MQTCHQISLLTMLSSNAPLMPPPISSEQFTTAVEKGEKDESETRANAQIEGREYSFLR